MNPAFLNTMADNILNFAKKVLPFKAQKDIELLIKQCCKPTIVFGTDSCDDNNYAWGVRFNGVTITDISLANKTATLILTSSEHGGGAIQEVTFDENGVWTGDIQTSWWTSSGTEQVFIMLIPVGQRVVNISDVVTVTGVNNCD